MAWQKLPKAGSKSGLKSFGVSYDTGAGSNKLTANQLLMIQAAKHKGHSQSFGDMIKSAGHGGIHSVAWTFDKILRVPYGFTAAISAENKYSHEKGGLSNFSVGAFKAGARGFERGFRGKEKKGYGQVLQEEGKLKGHRRLRGAIGLGLDIGLDPLTYATGGTTIAANSAEHAAAVAAGRRAIRGALHDVLHEHKVPLNEVMDTSTGDLKALAKAGPNYRERLALAKEQLHHAVNGTDAAESRMRFLRTAAIKEEKRTEKFLPNFGVNKLRTPTTLGPSARVGGKTIAAGRQLVPALPKIGNVPFASGLVHAFITDKGMTTTTHAFQTQAKHLAERQLDQLHANVKLKLNEAAKGISDARQVDVVHPFEVPDKGWKAVVKGADGNFHVNEDYIQHLQSQGRLTPKEADFVRKTFDSTEYLYKNEKDFGASTPHYSESGRMYIPHVRSQKDLGRLSDSEMSAYAAGRLTTKAGFERSRKNAVSLKMLRDAGTPGIETNLNKAMAQRISASARRVSDLSHLDALTTLGGISKRLVNGEALAKNQAAKQDAIDRFEALKNEQTNALARTHRAEQRAKGAHEQQHRIDMATLTDAGATPARLAKRQAVHAKETEAIANGTFFPKTAAEVKLWDKAAEHRATGARLHSQMADLADEVRKLVSQEKKILKGRANPEYKAAIHSTTSAKDKYGHDIAFQSKELAHAVDKIRNVMAGDSETIGSFDKFYRAGLSKWKLAVTSINPGYRMRNSVTDMWNWWLKPGVNAYTAGKYLTKGTLLMKRLKNIEEKIAKNGGVKTEQMLKDLRMFKDMYDHGVLSGLFKGDIQDVADFLKFADAKVALVKRGHVLAAFEKAAQDMNRNGENWVRIGHYLWARDKGLGPAEAADSVKSAHFDYEHLTELEQKRMKLIAPFYTWTRKNIPYQIKAMAEAPGKYAAFPQAVQESEYAAGGDKGNILPSYIPKNFGFQIPFGKHNYLLPQLGVSDLQAVDSPHGVLDRGVQMLSPAIKAPMELILNKSAFTGAPIRSDTHALAPTSPAVEGLLSLLHLGKTGTTSRIGAGGKHVSSPGVDPQMLYILKEFGPAANFLTKVGAPSTKINPLISYAGGLSVTHVDPAQQQLLSQIALTAAAKKAMQTLRDEGLAPQAKRKTSSRTKRRNDLLNQLQGRR